MNKEQLETLAREAAKSIKTEADLTDFRQMLTKVTIEAALNAELGENAEFGKNRTLIDSTSRAALIFSSAISAKHCLDCPRLQPDWHLRNHQ